MFEPLFPVSLPRVCRQASPLTEGGTFVVLISVLFLVPPHPAPCAVPSTVPGSQNKTCILLAWVAFLQRGEVGEGSGVVDWPRGEPSSN